MKNYTQNSSNLDFIAFEVDASNETLEGCNPQFTSLSIYYTFTQHFPLVSHPVYSTSALNKIQRVRNVTNTLCIFQYVHI